MECTDTIENAGNLPTRIYGILALSPTEMGHKDRLRLWFEYMIYNSTSLPDINH